MARFDVYPNYDLQEREWIPYFLDVQNDHIVGLVTRVVVPLWSPEHLSVRAKHLNPELQINGQSFIMDTPALGAVPLKALRSPAHNLASQQLLIQDALDTLFGSY